MRRECERRSLTVNEGGATMIEVDVNGLLIQKDSHYLGRGKENEAPIYVS